MSGTRLPSLTGLRFAAALAVFAFHAAIEGVFADPGLGAGLGSAVSRAGFFGVEFFFVLSGFVLTWNHRPGRARSFWWRRARKVYPNHVVTWVAAVVLMAVAGQAVVGWQVLPNLLLVHAWVPVPEVLSSANIVAWSLACEVVFYLLFPLLHRVVAGVRRLWWWVGGAVALIFLLPVVALVFLPGDPVVATPGGPVPFHAVWFVYLFPLARVPEFVLGMLVARLVRDGRWTPPSLGVSALLAGLAYLAAFTVPYLWSKVAVGAVPLALVIASAAVADLRGSPSPLRSRAFVWLGEVSFAFYLVHRLVLVTGHSLLGGGAWGVLGGVAFLVGALGVSLLLSWALYTGVERPLTRRVVTNGEKARRG
ncbi:acyltransferase family protein [Actinokineospora spheciospongiae]|uniref:acyltransferase family protein n=1 Tax=Actinokineospora spheciospongiae TaxID=909613 RepID=UPI000D70A05C|nr:acyltransferase [Actinokineospora spheciospongiae]PWW64709.1 peptidoglycan/LPS O-acetylase OafA/YrhL [Actinokineospora spheciospongiae]